MVGCSDQRKLMHAARASHGGSEGWRNGPPFAIPLANMPRTRKSGGPGRHRIPLGRRQVYLESALATGLLLEDCQRADSGTQRSYEKVLELPRARQRHSRCSRRAARVNRLVLEPHHQAQTLLSLCGSGRVRAAVDGSEALACLYQQQSWHCAGFSSRSHWSVGRPREERSSPNRAISLSSEIASGKSETHWGVNGRSDGRQHCSRLSIAMGSRRRGGLDPMACRERHATLAVHGAATVNPRKNSFIYFGQAGQPGPACRAQQLRGTSCWRWHTRRDRTTRWEGWGGGKHRPSPRLGTGAHEGQEPLHAFGRGQRTHPVSYRPRNSGELEGASLGLKSTRR